MRAIILLLVIAPALVAQDAAFTWAGRVASGGTFRVHHFNGAISVREASGDRVELEAARPRRGGDLTFQVENQSDGVRICAVWRGRSACDDNRRGWSWDDGPSSSRLTIQLPKGVRLDAVTGNGDVTVERASNDVQIRTGNGDVRIRMTGGSVVVRTGNGELEIDGATGPVQANSGNGRVYVTTAAGPVNVRTGNGAIDVRMKSMPAAAEMSFATGNGAVTVALPESFSGAVEATTGRGEFRSDFPIQITGRVNPRRARGTIGSGAANLKISSGNGPIELRKSP